MKKISVFPGKGDHKVIIRLIRDLEEKPIYPAPFNGNFTYPKKRKMNTFDATILQNDLLFGLNVPDFD